MTGPLARLTEMGQSLWYDYIRRDLLETGELADLIEKDSLRGMTTNPTIFANAVAKTELYDEEIRAMGAAEAADVFEKIAVADVRRAAEIFLPLYERTRGKDGFVSIEVRPTFARDTAATIQEARRLWRACDRPNVMIKIPGTKEGLPAVETALYEGINVNITLLFSVERYREVIEAWARAVERRLAENRPVDRLASVASFFVSRVDTLLDKELEKRAADAAAGAILHKLAIDNARLAYSGFEETFANPRISGLLTRGARPQRPLWASTSTKNPDLPAGFYVEALIAPHTVNTVPPETFAAYRAEGNPAVRIREGLDEARRRVASLAEFGIDFAASLRHLEDDGVKKFTVSYEELLAAIEKKRTAIGAR